MTLELVSAADRPDLVDAAEAMSSGLWPAYLKTTALQTYWSDLYSPALASFQTIAYDEASGTIAAIGNAIPFYQFSGAPLPDTGWDWAIENGVMAARNGTPVNSLSALAVTVAPEHRGSGLAAQMLEEMKRPARVAGLTDMVAPVRPTLKSCYPLQSFDTYCSWRRADGSLFDPWLRSHEQLGATIIGPAKQSMSVIAPIPQWETWTGLHLPENGAYVIERALAPLIVDHMTGLGTYHEPNLWMRHQLT